MTAFGWFCAACTVGSGSLLACHRVSPVTAARILAPLWLVRLAARAEAHRG